MSDAPEAPKGTVEELRERLNRLVPQLTPDVEPAVMSEADTGEPMGEVGG